jgi:hypothetical protein
MIGPNCPGITTPDAGKVGFMPNFIHREGNDQGRSGRTSISSGTDHRRFTPIVKTWTSAPMSGTGISSGYRFHVEAIVKIFKGDREDRKIGSRLY